MAALSVIHMVADLPSVTGLPEDSVQMTVNIGCDTITPGSLTNEMEAFRDFFIVQAAGASIALSNWVGQPISRGANACSITSYFTDDLTGATPLGSPVGSVNFTMGGQAVGEDMAEEVAIVISYNGDLTDVPVTEANPTPPPAIIRPQQRRRGRLFFGPLVAGVGSTVSGSTRPTATIRTDLTAAFKVLCETVNNDPDLYVGVWSKADADVYACVGGYVDDAFDTQRRRGPAPTTRTTFVVT